MQTSLTEKLISIRTSFEYCVPEVVLVCGLIIVLVAGFFRPRHTVMHLLAFLVFFVTLMATIIQWEVFAVPATLFNGMLRSDDFSAYFKILFNIAAIFTLAMTWRHSLYLQAAPHPNVQASDHYVRGEYYCLLIAIVLGAQLLVMSKTFVTAFISLELISISSYALTTFAFDKKGAEGGLKYFMFGSVASAIMLYGFSLLYGLTGTLDFMSETFAERLIQNNSPLFFIGGFMALAGFLYKAAAAPLHPWVPDVYESAPMPVVAFFSVVPKLAGIGILAKFVLVMNLFGQSRFDWQSIVGVVAMLTLTVGNFSALWQKHPKRLMAYSSIAQSGFLMAGLVSFLPAGLQFMLFYASVYLLMNFVVFLYLQYFEHHGVQTIEDFTGTGRSFTYPGIMMLLGLISLTGLPPTSGFTAKLFVFSGLWDSYQLTGKQILLWFLVFGLLNTVVSLAYYLRIPYHAFIKTREISFKANILTFENLLGTILVLLILLLFFSPGLLMGWINKINFVL